MIIAIFGTIIITLFCFWGASMAYEYTESQWKHDLVDWMVRIIPPTSFFLLWRSEKGRWFWQDEEIKKKELPK